MLLFLECSHYLRRRNASDGLQTIAGDSKRRLKIADILAIAGFVSKRISLSIKRDCEPQLASYKQSSLKLEFPTVQTAE